MIGKISIGGSFYGCLSYCLEDKKPEKTKEAAFLNRAEVLMFHQCFGDKQELTQQFEDVRAINKRVATPVLHIALSLSPGEQLDKARQMDMVEACAQCLGFEKNQYVAIRHLDTNHQHLHIVANRVGFDGKVAKDHHNYRKIASFCRQMEKRYGLRQILSPRRFLPPEERHAPRLDQRKEAIRVQVERSLAGSGNMTEFIKNMQQNGYKVCKGRGIVFIDPKTVKVKGSELGYPLWKVEKIMEQQRLKNQKEQIQGPGKQGLQKDNNGFQTPSNSNEEKSSSKMQEKQSTAPQEEQNRGRSLGR